MASKFQNRLVGNIILVALGVILLPGMLDGKKKHYQDEFAAIPLVAKPGDSNEPDMLPAVTQALPSQPPEGAAEEVRAGNATVPSLDSSQITVNRNEDLNEVPMPVTPHRPKSVTPAPEKTQTKPPRETVSTTPVKREDTTAQQVIAPPIGKAYVVQLGALKNADKVNEIVAKLRTSGYRVYTLPSTPVQGNITRILVGPDTSRDKLQRSLGDLHQVSGLNGVILNYSVN